MIIFRYKNSNLDQKDGQRNMWVIIWQTWTTPKLPSGGIFYVASVFYQGMQIIAQSRYGCSYLWLKPTRRLFWVARGCCFGKNSKIKETSMNKPSNSSLSNCTDLHQYIYYIYQRYRIESPDAWQVIMIMESIFYKIVQWRHDININSQLK